MIIITGRTLKTVKDDPVGGSLEDTAQEVWLMYFIKL